MKRKLISVLERSNGWKAQEKDGVLVFYHDARGKAGSDIHFCTENYASSRQAGKKTGPVICEFDTLEKNLLGLYCHAGGMPRKARQMADYEYEAIVKTGSVTVAESILRKTFSEREMGRIVSLSEDSYENDKIQILISQDRFEYRYCLDGWFLRIEKGSFRYFRTAETYAMLFRALFIRKVYGRDEVLQEAIHGLSAYEKVRIFGFYLKGTEPDAADVQSFTVSGYTGNKRPPAKYQKGLTPTQEFDFARTNQFVIWRGRSLIWFYREKDISRLLLVGRLERRQEQEILLKAEPERGGGTEELLSEEETLNRFLLSGEEEVRTALLSMQEEAPVFERSLTREEELFVAGIWERYGKLLKSLPEDELKNPSSLKKAVVRIWTVDPGRDWPADGTAFWTDEEEAGRLMSSPGISFLPKADNALAYAAVDYEEDLACIARYGAD